MVWNRLVVCASLLLANSLFAEDEDVSVFDDSFFEEETSASAPKSSMTSSTETVAFRQKVFQRK